MKGKWICAVALLLCMVLTACAPEEAPKKTETTSPSHSEDSATPSDSVKPTESGDTTNPAAPAESTGIPNPTDPSDPAEPEQSEPSAGQTTEAPVGETTQPSAAVTPGELACGCYDNDTEKVSLAFREDGTVYLMDGDGYWKGDFQWDGQQLTLVFAYKTETGTLEEGGGLSLEGRSGSFRPVGESNGYGPKLSAILGGGEESAVMTELVGSWYNQTEDSTLIFNEDGTLYQVLSVAIMEGSVQRDGDGYILRFSFGGKVFGPYYARLNSEGELVLEGQDGVYMKK